MKLFFPIIRVMLGIFFIMALTGCKKNPPKDAQNITEKIIAEASEMSLLDLFKKALAESNGKTLYALANSSRGVAAAAAFIDEVRLVDPSYSLKVDWFCPKNNTIFSLLSSDAGKVSPKYSMTLIQDGDQIKRKMMDTGLLLNFIPKEWRESRLTDKENDSNPLALQTLNKVFEFNNLGGRAYRNVWDFVRAGERPLFMGTDGECVGRNFLCMLTKDEYSAYLEDAYLALGAKERAYFSPYLTEAASLMTTLGFSNPNAKYGLAFARLWGEQYSAAIDDGPVCEEICSSSGRGKTALIVYSKFRSIKETPLSSVNNVTVAAYQEGYKGIGGFAYKHYLQVCRNSPLPWTACAFIAYMVTSKDGFAPWGKDMGGYPSNPACSQSHETDGVVDGVNKFPVKNDRGAQWWLSKDGGRLVVEDPSYVAAHSSTFFDWLSTLR